MAKTESLLKRRLQEAIPGSITAEKVPTGGDAAPVAPADDIGAEPQAPETSEIVLTVSAESVDSVLQVLSGLRSLAGIQSCTCDGEECGGPDEPPAEPDAPAAEPIDAEPPVEDDEK